MAPPLAVHSRPRFRKPTRRADDVSHALILHSGPVRSFELVAPKPSPSVNYWLVSLSLRATDSLRSLILDFHSGNDRTTYSLHSAALSFSNLTSISLYKCCVALPDDFLGFKHLQSLHLEEVDFEDGCKLSALISASPVLETLRLIQVTGSGCLKIRGPGIRRLDYDDVHFDNFALGRCPVLSYADIRLYYVQRGEPYHDSGDDYDGEEQWLHLGQHSSEIVARHGITETMPIRFNHILAVTLGIDFGDIDSITAAIRLLSSCPNIQKLTVESCSNWYDDEVEDSKDIWEAKEQFKISPTLKTVEMRDIMLKESELEFIRVILETGEALETLTIHFSDQSTKANELAIMKLSEYQRASNRARVIFAR